MRFSSLFALSLAAGAAFVTVPASAQNDVSVMNRISRVEREMQSLNQHLYGKMDGMRGGPSGGFAADTELRLSRIENEMQRLTGQVEQMMHQISLMQNEMGHINSDMQLRMGDIEKQVIGGAPSGMAGQMGQMNNPALTAAQTDHRMGGVDRNMATGALMSGSDFQTDSSVVSDAMMQDPDDMVASPQTGSAGAAEMLGSMSGGPEADYDLALSLMRKGDYDKAQVAFKRFIENYDTHPLAGNVQYWLGETYYAQGDFTEAAVLFAEGYKKYPASSKAADNLIKLAMTLSQMDRKEDACITLQQLGSQFPDLPTAMRRQVDNENKRLACQ